MSPEQTDVEDQVAKALSSHCELWRKWGAMSLYHRKERPSLVGSFLKGAVRKTNSLRSSTCSDFVDEWGKGQVERGLVT